ncbi:aminotransferase class I/II-fold pyridoxal phosphate-dependent enzyme [Candidatus Woesearchaeota archaeon]|nr:aminotransferase class I/II-fold pyridoxal phosphate-dependent enzyme [Candidatus Woesearchaeota archaeon]
MFEKIKSIDPELHDALAGELNRQKNTIELIASENFVSEEVLEVMGSILTNKYSEGYPGKRYYAGNKFIDISENLAIKRAKKLFNAEHANVQAHSGSQANLAAYMALLDPGDKILGMSLSHGGHLTHGHKINFSGKLFNFVHYGVDKKTEQLDYEEIKKIALKEKPKMIVCGASAYPRTIDFRKFKEIADEVGSYLVADVAHIAGLIVTGLHPSPFPYTDVVTTTTHKTLRGPRGAVILCKKEHAEKIDKAVFPGMQGGPMEHTIAAKAAAFKEALDSKFKEYQKQVIENTKALSYSLKSKGFRLVSGGTDNHLILLDLSKKGISGKQAEIALENANITVNKNMIPFDKRSPLDPSGIRIGTPAVTTRGFKEDEMEVIADAIDKSIKNINDKEEIESIKKDMIKLCEGFPLYQRC